MTDPTIPQRVLFPDLGSKPVVATFDREQASSDGGAVLLKAAERVYDLVKRFARCLVDTRAPEKIRQTLEDLIGQRVFGIACGHPDGNDADHLAEAPSTSCCWAGTRSAASAWRRSRRCRDSRTASAERPVPDGAGAGRERHRTAPATPEGADAADHDRPGPDRRPDTRRAAAHRVAGPQHRGTEILLRLPAERHERQQRQIAPRVVEPVAEGGLRRSDALLSRLLPLLRCAFPPGALPRAARLGVCDTGGLRLPRCLPAGRLRGFDAQERRADTARRGGHDAGAGAQCAQRPDRARLRRDALRVPLLEAAAARRDEGRGRPTRGPRAARQSPLRRDQPGSSPAVRLREGLLRAR